jgi:hypothetical protein
MRIAEKPCNSDYRMTAFDKISTFLYIQFLSLITYTVTRLYLNFNNIALLTIVYFCITFFFFFLILCQRTTLMFKIILIKKKKYILIR